MSSKKPAKTKTQLKREEIKAKSEAILAEHGGKDRKGIGGPPKIYDNHLDLEADIAAYFLACENRTREMITKEGKVIAVKAPAPEHITGLCCFLGISDDTLLNYQKSDELFGSVIARAKKRCEQYAVNALFEGQKGNKADFVLQNNFKWKNKNETEHTFKGDMASRIIAGRKRAKIKKD